MIKGEIQISKNEWKSAIKSEAAIQNGIILSRKTESLSKLEMMKAEKYQQKAY